MANVCKGIVQVQMKFFHIVGCGDVGISQPLIITQ